VLTIRPGATVTVQRVTIRGGSAAQGGGIANEGSLTLRGVTVRGNEATRAGGILNRGALKLIGGSSVRSNRATAWGGGVVNNGTTSGVVCGGNVRLNKPEDCVER
jgi:hypothetical protein